MCDNETNSNADVFRVGVVSFLNARVLTHALTGDDFLSRSAASVCLGREVPACLGDGLNKGRFDAALVPSIDYQNSLSEWVILPAGAICSDGEVLTVRVFSRCPLQQVRRLYCDCDSHTSTVLAQIIWQLRFGRPLEIAPLGFRTGQEDDFSRYEAILLIGDKVLGQLGQWPCELDLGQAWRDHTSLPFVYAFWAVRAQARLDRLVELLNAARAEGIRQIDEIVREYGHSHGFDDDLARRYLTENISYEFGDRQREGLEKFYQLAKQLNLIRQVRPIRFYTLSG
jgi:chorismate dehydratase